MSQPITELYTDSEFFSPYAMSAFVVLTEKGIPFTVKTVDLAKEENKEAAYAALSLTRRVPTLAIGEFQLSESSAIAEYLEDIHPAHAVYPRDVKLRAKAREIKPGCAAICSRSAPSARPRWCSTTASSRRCPKPRRGPHAS